MADLFTRIVDGQQVNATNTNAPMIELETAINALSASVTGIDTLAEGNIIVGDATNKASDLDAKGDGKILIGNGTTIASQAVRGDATLANTGALTIASGAVTNTKLATDVKIGSLAAYQGNATASVTAALNEQMILRVHDKFDGTAFDSADTNSLCAIHGVEVYGSDPTMPHRVQRIYRDGPYWGYRVVISRRNMGTWEDVIDTGPMHGIVTENPEGITAVTVPAGNNIAGTVPAAWARLWIDYAKVCTPGYSYCALGEPLDDPPYVIKPQNIFASDEVLHTLDDSTVVAAINEVLDDVDNTIDMFRMTKWEAIYSGTTYKRGVVSLRFDDTTTEDYTVTYPLLLERNLVAGFAAISGRFDTAGYLTTAQALEMQEHGMEIMHHSRTHSATTDTYAEFYDEVVTAADELRAAGLCINQFIQPGAWSTGNPYYFETEDQLISREGRALRNNFAAMGAYVKTPESFDFTSHYGLPRRYRYGQPALSAYAESLPTLKDCIDKVIWHGVGHVDLFHSKDFDTPDVITTSDFTAFLDYVAAARDAGLIDVLTPTAQMYAVKSPMKVNLIDDGDFALSATGAWVYWQIADGAPTVEGGGRSGNCAQVNSANYIQQWIGGKNVRSLAIDCWAKSATGDPATARVIARSSDTADLNVVVDTAVAGEWVNIRFNIGVKPTISAVWLRLLNTGGEAPDVLFDDVLVYKT